MKILKSILIILGVIIGAVLVLGLFIKKDYVVEREISIQKPVSEVYGYIKYLKNQQDYSKWASMDPNQKTTYTGEDGQIGFVGAWESTNPDVGKGSQEIIGMVENQQVEYELKFIEPFESTANAYLLTDSTDAENTTVKWGFKGSTPYPMNVMTAMMNMEEMIGKDLEIGLQNLKAKLENE